MSTVASTSDTVDVLPAAFWIHRGSPPRMRAPHRHDDVEVNLVLSGQLDYIFGGSPLTVHAGELAVFWGATPHRLLAEDRRRDPLRESEPTRGCWLHVPLGTVLGWGLPADGIGRLLEMTAMIIPTSRLPYDPEPLFTAWDAELADDREQAAQRRDQQRYGCGGSVEDQPAGDSPALLEIQALLRRAVTRSVRADPTPPDGQSRPGDVGHPGPVLVAVTAMAQFIVTHFREPMTIDDIAAAGHLNRTYAATIFRRTLDTTPGRYLARCRVAEAQRLLLTTDKTMIDIAHASGFSSQSSFYEQFTRWCQSSPGDYRRRSPQLR